MSTQPQIGRLLSLKAGSRAMHTAFAVCAALAVSIPSLLAKEPTAAQAAAVASGTISVLISVDSSNALPSDAAKAIDALADQDIGVSDDQAIVKAALSTITDAIASNDSPQSEATLLATDMAIGQALVSDTTLEALPVKTGLISILETGIEGITGARGTAQTNEPEIAAAFVGGLVTGTIPNSITGVPDNLSYPVFATDILKNISRNTSVDELVANQIAAADATASPSLSGTDLVLLAQALFTKYTTAQDKIAQGIIAAIPPTSGTSETARIDFVQMLTGAEQRDAVTINEGAVFVDPYHAADFTDAVFSSITKASTLESDATRVATDVGEILGQDSIALANVAGVYSDFLTSGALKATSATTYALDLIKGAVKGLPTTVPVSVYAPQFPNADGGKLDIGTDITTNTADDLASIVDLIANGIASSPGNTSARIASQIGTLVENVAKLTKADSITGDYDTTSTTTTVPLPVFLAGALAQDIAGLSSSDQTAIFAAIQKDVTAINSHELKTDLINLFSASSTGFYTSYPVIGAISPQETTVTNL
jgi:hypothetical protein